MNQIERARFLKLIEFLENLDKGKFYFGSTVADYDEANKCGTVCCAIGWTPALFPELVQWDSKSKYWGGLILKGYEGAREYELVAAELFGISVDDAFNLFTPDYQCCLGLSWCRNNASPQQVAVMLREYLVKHQQAPNN